MRASKKQVEKILAERAKLISWYAWKYAGRGADRDDLTQEGCLAVLRLIKRHSKRNLARALDNSLRGMMRDAAERMRYRDDAMQLSAGAENDEGEEMSPEENLEDARATEDTESAELRCDCERMLESDDVGVAGMLMEGQTHEEIARALGLTQQAVAKRVRRMRSALEGLRAG